MRIAWIGILVVAATASALASTATLLRLSTALPPWVGLILHCAGAGACAAAARLRAGRGGVDFDAAWVTAALVPMLGPMLAWLIAPADDGTRINAHADFEAAQDARQEERKARSLSGDLDYDLSRELNAVTYREVLHRGTLDQKRNLLRSLGRRGERRHVEMMRRCLRDDDHEIRLCAHAELDRLAQGFEARIAALLPVIAEDTGEADSESRLELASIQLEFARSGVLDSEMARYWAHEAIKAADPLRYDQSSQVRATRIVGAAHAALGEHDAARRILAPLTEADTSADLLLTLAETAFAQRDLQTVRQHGLALEAAGHEVPDWITAIGDGRTAALNESLWGAGR